MSSIKLFQNTAIRSQWDADKEQWLFSVIDVVGALTGSENPRKYWSVLKTRLKKEGSQLATNCSQLKMLSADGKSYLTDVANTESLLRLIQSIPSPRAEPFKLWLAQVGYERLEENEDPELSIDRALEAYLAKGYSKEWINQRLKSIEVRKELTDEWELRGVSRGQEFAMLTDEITRAWSGLSTKGYKQHKGLKKENLRDNMSNLELVLNMLAEATTTEISKEKLPQSLDENRVVARQGGEVAGNARKEIEAKTGKKVISDKNAKQLGRTKSLELPKK
ncbi:MAG: BRO family protein [Gallionellaceae bacterium]